MTKDEIHAGTSIGLSKNYEPTLTDVAKILASTGGKGPQPETIGLVRWLIEQLIEMRKPWLNDQICHQDATLASFVGLLRCLIVQCESKDAYATAVWLLRQHPHTREILDQLEKMCRDAGSFSRFPGVALNVVRQHDQVDRILGIGTWISGEEALDLLTSEPDYQAFEQILGARLAREEGDPERIVAVRASLRAKRRPESTRSAQHLDQRLTDLIKQCEKQYSRLEVHPPRRAPGSYPWRQERRDPVD